MAKITKRDVAINTRDLVAQNLGCPAQEVAHVFVVAVQHGTGEEFSVQMYSCATGGNCALDPEDQARVSQERGELVCDALTSGSDEPEKPITPQGSGKIWS